MSRQALVPGLRQCWIIFVVPLPSCIPVKAFISEGIRHPERWSSSSTGRLLAAVNQRTLRRKADLTGHDLALALAYLLGTQSAELSHGVLSPSASHAGRLLHGLATYPQQACEGSHAPPQPQDGGRWPARICTLRFPASVHTLYQTVLHFAKCLSCGGISSQRLPCQDLYAALSAPVHILNQRLLPFRDVLWWRDEPTQTALS